MGKNSKINWTNHTWNPWQGCRKVSEGCTYCYMYRDKTRFRQDPTDIVRSKDATFNMPFRVKKYALVFVCSWSDFFIEQADEWRSEAWDIIKACPHLDFQLLTKRPENIVDRLPADWGSGGYPNVWLGVTAENQEMANARIPVLLEIPNICHFISIEPMLSSVNLNPFDRQKIDWVIVGGESGNKFRPMDPNWALGVLQQCQQKGIPFFMKQMAGRLKPERELIPDYLDIQEFPEVYRVR